jgi:DNA-directed RNA polymerase specialized sigma subunit
LDEALDKKAQMIESNMVDVKVLEEVESIKALLQDREVLQRSAEADLRKSKEIEDVVYVMRYIDGIQPDQIAEEIGYSRSQVYRMLQKMNI